MIHPRPQHTFGTLNQIFNLLVEMRLSENAFLLELGRMYERQKSTGKGSGEPDHEALQRMAD